MKYFNVFMRNGAIQNIIEYDSLHQRNMVAIDHQLRHGRAQASATNDITFDLYTIVLPFDKVENSDIE